jgi:hypothetical protein
MHNIWKNGWTVAATAALLGSCAELGGELGDSESGDVETTVAELAGGTTVPVTELQAVGRSLSTVFTCSATLIHDDVALTAGHCVCEDQSTPTGCVKRARFQFKQVFPVDNPATPANESLTRTDVTVWGDVLVHPEYTLGGWLRNDYAIIKLDQPASAVTVGVSPIWVQSADTPPLTGDSVTLVGFGFTDTAGGNCDTGSGVKRRATLAIDERLQYDVGGVTLTFSDPVIHMCPGDSGGPALRGNRIVGVASTLNGSTNSAYDATDVITDWLAAVVCPVLDTAVPDDGFCTNPLCPCTEGEGDCDSDSQCVDGLVCNANTGATYGLPAHYDICEAPPP